MGFVFLEHHALSDWVQTVDERDPFQVVEFMLDAYRKKPIRFKIELAALGIVGFDVNLIPPFDLGADTGKGKAAFLIRRPTMAIDDHGVDKVEQGVLTLLLLNIHGHDFDVATDLWCGKPDTMRCVHSVRHSMHEIHQFLIDLCDVCTGRFKNFIGIMNEGEAFHS